MNNKFIIGQYYPANSYIHSLDPRVKLTGVFLFITLLLFADSATSYLFASVCLVLVVYASNIPARYMLKGMRSILVIILLSVSLNIFFTPGENALVEFWVIKIYPEGLIHAAKIVVRIMLLITGSSLLMLTTTPLSLTDAIEYILKPFKKIGVPAHDIAMMTTIALRFIPTLLEETDKIIKAQTARGAGFDTGGLIKKAKAMVPLLVPLFISAFRRAEDLATAMEARCYRGDIGRTKMKILRLDRNDYKAVALLFVFTAVILVLFFLRPAW